MPRSLVERRRTETTALRNWVKPQLTRLVDQPPEGPEWLHVIKFDGYRMHARPDRGEVRLLTRTFLAAEPPPLIGRRHDRYVSRFRSAPETASRSHRQFRGRRPSIIRPPSAGRRRARRETPRSRSAPRWRRAD